MTTSANRGSTWTNSDGLVVGFGTNKPTLTGSDLCNDDGGVKTLAVKFDYADLNAGSTITLPVPAGSKILTVRWECETLWTSTGTNTAKVGDASADNGFITETLLTVANMTAGAVLYADGVYMYGATDTAATENHLYAAATSVVVASAMTDWLTGKATVIVSYI